MEDLGKQIEDLIASKKAKEELAKSEKKILSEKEQHTPSVVNGKDIVIKESTPTTNIVDDTVEKKQNILRSIDEIIASKEKEAQLAKQNLKNIKKTNVSIPNKVTPSVSAEMDAIISASKRDLLHKNNIEKPVSSTISDVEDTTKKGKNLDTQNKIITKKEIISELRLAKKEHKQWIANVHVLIRIGDIEEAKSIIPVSFTSCGFGKWYYGEGQMLAEFEAYQDLEKSHQKIHDIYLQIFNLYKVKIEGSFFNSAKKQLKERENKAVSLSKKLDYQSDLLFKKLLLLEEVIKKLSDAKMAELNLI